MKALVISSVSPFLTRRHGLEHVQVDAYSPSLRDIVAENAGRMAVYEGSHDTTRNLAKERSQNRTA